MENSKTCQIEDPIVAPWEYFLSVSLASTKNTSTI
jgi:hypothetical protein